MLKPVEVKALPNYRLWIAYSDGTQGIVDLSHLVGRGVFRLWEDPQAFDQVYIGAEGQIAWSDEIDLCPDALYIEITGKTPENDGGLFWTFASPSPGNDDRVGSTAPGRVAGCLGESAKSGTIGQD